MTYPPAEAPDGCPAKLTSISSAEMRGADGGSETEGEGGRERERERASELPDVQA